METSRKGKLIVTGRTFIPMFSGTKVEDIPADMGFYLEKLQDIYPSLSAISLDNSDRGMHITLMTDDINLNSWTKPFSFDEYIKQLESLIGSLILPIKKLYRHDDINSVSYTVLGLDFLVKRGDLMIQILKYSEDFSNAQNEASRILLNKNLSNNPHAFDNYEFIEGKKCALEENLTTEFKEIKGINPVGSIQKQVGDYILAFFNSEGGSIFWGISDDGVVKSLTLSSKLKDEIRKSINSKINTIEPSIDPTQIKIIFHLVSNVEEGYVLEVKTPKSNTKSLYFNTSGHTFVRLNGCNQKLQGSALQDCIIQRQQGDS